jgi:DNA-binding response OmpR family regulator
MRILLVDDDVPLCELLSEYLEGEGIEVEAVHEGAAAMSRLAAAPQRWDAIILDVMLPGMNGFDLLKAIRPVTPTPVLMLTARGEDTDTVLGLELGADDYVAKPVSPRVLVARLRALLRRGAEVHAEQLQVGDLQLDEQARRLRVGGEEVALTGAEFNLLALLVKAAGHVVSRETMAAEGLGRPLQAYDRRIETHMAQIRRKLGALPDGSPRIKTVRGAGYQYVVSRDPGR